MPDNRTGSVSEQAEMRTEETDLTPIALLR